MIKQEIIKVLIMSLIISTIMACAGGGETGTGQIEQPQKTETVVGKITRFGSVYVNGIKFDTTNASIYVDGEPTDESLLGLGMIVTIEGVIDADGKTGQAFVINYTSDVKGTVSTNELDANNVRVIKVLGQSIIIDSETEFESEVTGITDPSQITNIHNIEVSGYGLGDGVIHATRIEVKNELDEYKLRGTIDSEPNGNTFLMGEILVDYSLVSSNDLPANGLALGDWVEVESDHQATLIEGQLVIVAKEIEFIREHEFSDEKKEGEELELEGLLTSAELVDEQVVFSVNEYEFVTSVNTEYEGGTAQDLLNALSKKVKVSARKNSEGVWLAKEIHFYPQGSDLKLKSFVQTVDVSAGIITLLGQSIVVTQSTIMEDDSEAELKHFGLENLSSDPMQADWLELKITWDANLQQFIANRLVRIDAPEDAYSRVEGAIEFVDNNRIKLTKLNIEFDLSVEPSELGIGQYIEIDGLFDVDIQSFSVVDWEVDD
ncbi:MAG: DUF5666 domain-containing protein [Gammaproteobacteria bacterium]|nr:DUF5666 domain-containing protein [Gammaproteobacteria bacterium]